VKGREKLSTNRIKILKYDSVYEGGRPGTRDFTFLGILEDWHDLVVV